MKNAILFLLMATVSSTVFADQCITKNLTAEKERISSIKNLSASEKAFLLTGVRDLKLLQILRCTKMMKVISVEDVTFAVAAINQDRTRKIALIEKEEINLRSLLQDQSIEDEERSLYSQVLSLIPKRISQENRFADTLVANLRKASK